MKFYHEEINNVLKKLKTSLAGLSEEEANLRLLRYGKNELPRKKPDTIFKIFLRQTKDPIIIILFITIIFSFLIGEYYDAIIVTFIVFADLIMGLIQEYNAVKKALSLENIIKVECKVLRDGKKITIPSSSLVVGDIVFLESGNKISADLRIIESSNLTVDESILTGESLAVYKNSDIILEKDIRKFEQTNMLYAGSIVLTGRAKGVVVATGVLTEIGDIAKSVTETKEEKSPLTIRIQKFSKQISIIVLILAFFLTILLLIKGNEINEVFMAVIALSISALPEGLPLALTMALTIASNRMLKENVIVKKLNSVESLGSCTLIASDKTGTLTVNEQTAKLIVLPNKKEYEITGSGYNQDGKVIVNDKNDLDKILEIIKLGLINNEASLQIYNDYHEYQGDSIDVAFLALALKMQVSKNDIEIIYTIPYESINKYSAIIYKIKNTETIYCTVKGSLEKVLDFTSKMQVNDKTLKLDRELLLAQNENLAKNGYRVIALASGIIKKQVEYQESDLKNLTFKGLVAFIDPIRKDCLESIQKSLQAKVKVVMITGDHPLTAFSIAKSLGIANSKSEVASGSEISKKLQEGVIAIDSYIKDKKVFARVTPKEKLEIVNAFKRQGEFVAVTGDGVNDAPALKAAHIGISMGSGTDVSRETSNMILTNDNFSAIVSGIIEGRAAYSNIRKVSYMLISCGLGEVLFFVLSIIFNFPMPLLAIQILWLNVVTDGVQDLALSFEKPESDIMNYPPRPKDENLFDKTLITEVLLSGLTIGLLVFLIWVYLIKVLNFSVEISRGYIMALMVFIQNVHVLNCRSETKSIFSSKIKPNYFVIFSIIFSIILQFIIMEVPILSSFLKVTTIPFLDLIVLFILSLAILLVMEFYKLIKYKDLN